MKKDSEWQNEPLRPAPDWLAPPNEVLIDTMMWGRWTCNEKRDKALHWAIYATRGASDLCAVLAAECSTGNDERMPRTTDIVRYCAEECQTAMVALARWETIDPDALRSAVESCIEACAETSTEFQPYLLGLYSGEFKHPHELRDTILLLRGVDSVLDDCREAGEGFLSVWFESRIDE
jgi:hypothetical protein